MNLRFGILLIIQILLIRVRIAENIPQIITLASTNYKPSYTVENLVKILIVEHDMLVAAKVSMQLVNLGYEVTGIVSRGDEAIWHVEEYRPDIVLLDISLKGKLDGIETAHILHANDDIPIIFVSATTDAEIFNRAIETRPHAFISKPVNDVDLQRAIELTISRMADKHHISAPEVLHTHTDEPSEHAVEAHFVLSDRIFVRHKDKMIKIFVEDIMHIEAERNYCHLYTKLKDYLLTTTLKNMEDKLPTTQFVRVHRSYLVNIGQIDEVSESHVTVNRKAIPLSTVLREDLLKHIKTI